MKKMLINLPAGRAYLQHSNYAAVKISRSCYNKLTEAANNSGLSIRAIMDKIIGEVEFRYWYEDTEV